MFHERIFTKEQARETNRRIGISMNLSRSGL